MSINGSKNNNFLSEDDFNNLRNKIKNECKRRKYSREWRNYELQNIDWNVQPNYIIKKATINKIANVFSNININQKTIQKMTNEDYEGIVTNDLQLIWDTVEQLEKYDSTTTKAEISTTGCSASCTGFCANDCGKACTEGCSNGCFGACIGTCSGTCSNTCSGTCSNTCSGRCGDGCTNDCAQQCSTGCATGCYNGCGEGCTGTCGDACSTSCSGDCEKSCTGCGAGCANTCSGGCTGSCQYVAGAG